MQEIDGGILRQVRFKSPEGPNRFASLASLPLALSPDERWLALGTASGVYLYDFPALKHRLICRTPGAALSVAFTADSLRLAAGGNGGAVALWNLADGHLQRVFPLPNGVGRSLAISAGGQYLAVGDAHMLMIWNVTDGTLRWQAQPTGWIGALTFTADDATLIAADTGNLEPTGAANGAVLSQRASDGAPLAHRPDLQAVAAALTPNSLLGYIRNGSHDIEVEQAESGRGVADVHVEDNGGRVQQLALSRNGTWLVAGDSYGRVYLWATEYGIRQTDPPRRHSDPVTGVAVTEDGRFIVSASHDGTLLLWRR